MTTTAASNRRGWQPAELLAALATVRDPELDEPITSLGFVAACALSPDGEAEVRLRLPTYFCAPNFAYLMVADAYDAVMAVPGVRTAHVLLEDHFAAEAINGGVAAQAGFAQSFDGEAIGELHELRRDFLRKAVLAGTDQVCRALRADGAHLADGSRRGNRSHRADDSHRADSTHRADGAHLAGDERLRALTLGEVPPSAALARLRERRAELGLPAGDDAPLLVDPATGGPVSAEAVPLHLRRARVTAINMAANGSICRGMLRHRYSTSGQGESASGEYDEYDEYDEGEEIR
jgi:metal-sulfur cluster biosynthetic enzyme